MAVIAASASALFFQKIGLSILLGFVAWFLTWGLVKEEIESQGLMRFRASRRRKAASKAFEEIDKRGSGDL
ncbi:hypothetical protein ACFQDL_32820 [Marinobacterium aestuariivivens]|uniref:EF-hand domain-containing protein n=1 Tax=Marinobacterium aestuariivivens TaxID=1698799 RepID=A0ABW2AA33_9GAMM